MTDLTTNIQNLAVKGCLCACRHWETYQYTVRVLERQCRDVHYCRRYTRILFIFI